jgi:hypothetical protein
MATTTRITLVVILILTAFVVLCQFISNSALLKLFLVIVAVMIVLIGGVYIMEEISKFRDLLHRHYVLREHRQLELERQKLQHFLLRIQHGRTGRSRYHRH